jgi:hypothetical protein
VLGGGGSAPVTCRQEDDELRHNKREWVGWESCTWDEAHSKG